MAWSWCNSLLVDEQTAMAEDSSCVSDMKVDVGSGVGIHSSWAASDGAPTDIPPSDSDETIEEGFNSAAALRRAVSRHLWNVGATNEICEMVDADKLQPCWLAPRDGRLAVVQMALRTATSTPQRPTPGVCGDLPSTPGLTTRH